MSDEQEQRTPEKGLDYYIQLIAGLIMWAWLMYSDHQNAQSAELADMSTLELAIMFGKYGFAAILIKGVSVKELAELISAWRKKQ